MKRTLSILSAEMLAGPVLADIAPEIVLQIEARLAEMACQMDPDAIVVEAQGYDLDDGICRGGNRFDITRDRELNEVGRRAE